MQVPFLASEVSQGPQTGLLPEGGVHESVLNVYITVQHFMNLSSYHFASTQVHSFHLIFQRNVSFQKSLRPSVLAHLFCKEDSGCL